jgi:hypothetical protein
MEKSSPTEKFALIHEHWRPKVVARLNGQDIRMPYPKLRWRYPNSGEGGGPEGRSKKAATLWECGGYAQDRI